VRLSSDTETTGLDPLNSERVVEIGAVELIDRSTTNQTFYRYVRVLQSASLHVRGRPRTGDHDPVEGAGRMKLRKQKGTPLPRCLSRYDSRDSSATM
jgi:hypothetical protein